MSHTLQKTGIVTEKINTLSMRVCLSCASKIRKTSEGFNFIAATLNVLNPKFVEPESEVEVKDVRVKRTFQTAVSMPERSHGQRKIARSEQSQEKRSGVRRQLGSQVGDQIENEDTILNIDDMISPKQLTQVPVLWLSGKTEL